METLFHPLTEKYLKETGLKLRKKFGQYFTPNYICRKLLSKLPKENAPLVLDPACGTGEFLRAAKRMFKTPVLHGWEIDGNLAEISKTILPEAKIKIIDALKQEYAEKYDFVIGNPPYFEFKSDTAIKNKFADTISGRANIFSMFIKIGLGMLKKGGYLAYVVPPSMNNGKYFSELRNYIIKNSSIESIEILSSADIFEGARQTVMLLVLKKEKNNGNFIFKKNGITLFNPDCRMLNKKLKNCETLGELGFSVKTGRLVWNQNKKLLTNNPRGAVRLIWSHNITDKGLSFDVKKSKPAYVKVKNCDTGPAIVVNRITGAPGKAEIRAAIIPEGMKFIAENHVNVIFPPAKSRIKLENILKQLLSAESRELFKNITGNTQISKNELECLFPVKKQ